MKRIVSALVFVSVLMGGFYFVFAEPPAFQAKGAEAHKKIGEQKRVYEKEGGFSYVPPEGWTEREVAVSGFSAFYGPSSKDSTPILAFSQHFSDLSLDGFVEESLIPYKANKNVTIVEKRTFKAFKNEIGYKIVFVVQRGEKKAGLGQYFFSRGKKKIVASGASSIKEWEKYNEVYDNVMKTFRWEGN